MSNNPSPFTWPTWEKATAGLESILRDAKKALAEGRFLAAQEHAERFNQQFVAFSEARSLIDLVIKRLLATEKDLESVCSKHPQLPAPTEVTAAVRVLIDQALTELADFDHGDFYDDARLTATNANEQLDLAIKAVDELIKALDDHEAKSKSLSLIAKRGYTSIVDDTLGNIEQLRTRAVSALKKGQYAAVCRNADEMIAEAARALSLMDVRVKLHDQNAQRIKAISAEVSEGYKNLKAALAHLGILKKGYHKDNFAAVAENCQQAQKLLDTLFDSPEDPNDFYSKALSHNDLAGKQNFDACRDLLVRMETDLATALRLIADLEIRYEAVLEAEKKHDAIMASALATYQKAMEFRDANNTAITAEIDAVLKQALAYGKQARKADDAGVFFEVVSLSLKIKELSESALADAKKQVSEIAEAFAQVKSAKASATAYYNTAEGAIQSASRVVVQSDTTRLLASAQRALATASRIEATCASLEDVELLAALKKAAQAYSEADSAARDAANSLREDNRSYQALLSGGRSAISSLESAQRAAQRVCSDSRAGSAGDGALASVSSMIPDAPREGMSRSALQSIVDQAEAAESKANSARQYAESTIAEYERRKREAEERERQRRAEIARREREAREAREREERRQEEAREARQREQRREEERRQESMRPHNFGGTSSGSSHNFGGTSVGGRHGF